MRGVRKFTLLAAPLYPREPVGHRTSISLVRLLSAPLRFPRVHARLHLHPHTCFMDAVRLAIMTSHTAQTFARRAQVARVAAHGAATTCRPHGVFSGGTAARRGLSRPAVRGFALNVGSLNSERVHCPRCDGTSIPTDGKTVVVRLLAEISVEVML